MTPHAHAHVPAHGAIPESTAGAPAPRPRPFVVPPAAPVPPPRDPADDEQRIEAAILALDRVRAQLERTRHALDVFISQITHIPAPAPGARPVVPAPVLPDAPLDATTGTPVALSGFVLGHAAPSAGPGPSAVSGVPAAPEPSGVPLTHRVAGRRVSPRASAAAQAGPAEPAPPVTYAAPETYVPPVTHAAPETYVPGAAYPARVTGAGPGTTARPAANAGPQARPPQGVPARRLGRPAGPRRATTPPEAGQVRPPMALSEHLRPGAPAPEQRRDGA